MKYSNFRRPSSSSFRPSQNSGPRPQAQGPRPENTAPRRPEPALPPSPPRTEAELAASPFAELGLTSALVRAVLDEGYSSPTPIQAQTIGHVLEGKDVLGCAQTGTGKTAAFLLPLLQRLGRGVRGGPIRALVITPTRELAAQIAERAAAYGRHLEVRHALIYGGVHQRGQERDIERHPDLVVATPGRLLDLIRQGFVRLDRVEALVLDEADTMLDMGFLPDVRQIISGMPKARQNLLFSATMPRPIEALAQTILRDPVRVSVTPQATTAQTVEQSVYFVPKPDKPSLLETVLNQTAVERALVFTRTKRGADRVCKQLARAGIVSAAIHGNKSQNARERALDHFRRGSTRVLVATDIAARGIDVQGVSHVINYDLPNVAESYVHRIGRTGRAGASGQAISFCDGEERVLLRGIEKLIGKRIPVAEQASRSGSSHRATAPAASAEALATQSAPAPERAFGASRPPAADSRGEPSFRRRAQFRH